MKKFVLFAAFAAVLGLGFAACGSKPEAPKEAAVEEETAEAGTAETTPSVGGDAITPTENSAAK
ncbi:MAG: hypothetical protein LBT07_00835 [Endomicrobium sp.]|jgi:ABC-type glycerol-3-phosphate transport system substrate-binding protein|nr:hypothetical protein [Endomicrobium sp.]